MISVMTHAVGRVSPEINTVLSHNGVYWKNKRISLIWLGNTVQFSAYIFEKFLSFKICSKKHITFSSLHSNLENFYDTIVTFCEMKIFEVLKVILQQMIYFFENDYGRILVFFFFFFFFFVWRITCCST